MRIYENTERHISHTEENGKTELKIGVHTRKNVGGNPQRHANETSENTRIRTLMKTEMRRHENAQTRERKHQIINTKKQQCVTENQKGELLKYGNEMEAKYPET